ncbi:hypothetical protein LTR53_003383 [Teratosphaeriaceae sp. CCFEE 6253]|nr:hypothetical protein LTR53_003383 [Teratosphaeriaceae sp. CCFEE 6253]
MAPAAKRRKTANEPKYHCLGCDTNRIGRSFPDSNPSSGCEHLINTCKTCLKKWVEAQVSSGLIVQAGKTFGIQCPECDAVMKSVDVEVAATKKVHQCFEELERKHIGENTPGWRWCFATGCRAGKVHEPIPAVTSLKRPRWKGRSLLKRDTVKEEPALVPDICVCHECGAKACVTCDRPWHEGENCAAYQVRIKDRVEEEDRALEEIRKITKPCPGCSRPVQKNGGCYVMSCRAWCLPHIGGKDADVTQARNAAPTFAGSVCTSSTGTVSTASVIRGEMMGAGRICGESLV